MSVTSDYFDSRVQAWNASDADNREELAAWIRVGLGAVVLGLYLLFAAITQSLWLVLLGPFALVGIARLMGAHSLWLDSSTESERQNTSEAGLVRQALRDSDTLSRQQHKAIALLEAVAGEGQPQLVIDELKAKIGTTGNGHAKSAYLIGRQYMQLEQYDEARDWLRRARRKNTKSSVLQKMVRAHLDACNAQLLAEGDACFEGGDYQGARERYARLSQGLERQEGEGFALYLRAACVYCKLWDYEDAHQAVLQALKSNQEPDTALALHDLLQQLSKPEYRVAKRDGARERLEKQLDDYVTEMMYGLFARR